MAEREEIILKNDPAEMDLLSEAVEGFLMAHGASLKTIFNVNLVLDEVVSNVIKYGFDSNEAAQHEIIVRLGIDGGRLHLEIEDGGKAFNPLVEAPDPTLEGEVEDRPIGGLGIHLVRSLMQNLSYQRENDRNRLSMDQALA